MRETVASDIRAICRLATVYDPRDPAQDANDPASWAWTDNAALCIADYLRTPKLDGGLGVPVAGIDWATVAAAADICDEIVPRRATEIACDVDEDGLVHLTEPHCVTGTRVRVATDGTLPGGLVAGTDYYWIATGTGRGRLAASLADARAGRAVEILHMRPSIGRRRMPTELGLYGLLAAGLIAAAGWAWMRARQAGRNAERAAQREKIVHAARIRADSEAALGGAPDDELDDWLRPPQRRR